MTTDGTAVQPTGQTSTAEPVPPVGVVPVVAGTIPEPPKATEPTPEEILNQKIADAVSRALAIETENSRRAIQSAKDKAMAEVTAAQRRAKMSESTLETMRSRLQTADPEVAKEMELAELRAQVQGRMTLEQEETLAKQQEAFYNDFSASQLQFVTDMDIDPTDKRVDWGKDALTPLEAKKRLEASVAKIHKENVQTMRGLEKRLQDLEKQAKAVSVEANSVSTATSSGVAESDKSFLKQWNDGTLPATKENLAKAAKLLIS